HGRSPKRRPSDVVASAGLTKIGPTPRQCLACRLAAFAADLQPNSQTVPWLRTRSSSPAQPSIAGYLQAGAPLRQLLPASRFAGFAAPFAAKNPYPSRAGFGARQHRNKLGTNQGGGRKIRPSRRPRVVRTSCREAGRRG